VDVLVVGRPDVGQDSVVDVAAGAAQRDDGQAVVLRGPGNSVPPSTTNAGSLIEYGSATGGWKTVPSPDPDAPNGNTILDGILALSNNNVWAVGTYDGNGGMKTLILH
jgi:hypothetical protein